MTNPATSHDHLTGWVCSHRKMWRHPIFKGNAQRVGAWTWLLHMAVWKPTTFTTQGDTVRLERGQLCVSQRQIEEATGMGRQALRTFLSELEDAGAIVRKPTHGATQGSTQRPTKRATQARTTITICKYDEYQNKPTEPTQAETQEPTQPVTTEQPTKEQDKQIPPSGDAAASPPAEVSEPVEVSVLKTTMWRLGKQYLERHGVSNPGAVIGRWLKDSTALEILQAIEAAQQAGTEDPLPYIAAVLNSPPTSKGAPRHDRAEQHRRESAATDEFIRRVKSGEIQRGPDPSDPFAWG